MSERLSSPPAGWKYEENCKVSESLCSVFLLRLFTSVHPDRFFYFYFASPLWGMSILIAYGKWNLETVHHICMSHIYLPNNQIPTEASLISAGHRFYENSKVSLFSQREKVSQSHCSAGFQQTVLTQLLPISTQALTMHFELQRLGGVVWCSCIVDVGHTAVRPLIVPPCSMDCQEETVTHLLDVHWIVAPRSFPNNMPALHVLVKGELKTKCKYTNKW